MIKKAGFTLIELVMVILLVGILAAVAIPQFADYRAEAKAGAFSGALGILRTAIGLKYMQQIVRCNGTVAQYPTLLAINANDVAKAASGGPCVGLAAPAPQTGTADAKFVTGSYPLNPYAAATGTPTATIQACGVGSICDIDIPLLKCGVATSCDGVANWTATTGWCYDATTGHIWANTKFNATTNECNL